LTEEKSIRPHLADGKTDCNRSEAAAQAYSGKKEQNLDEK